MPKSRNNTVVRHKCQASLTPSWLSLVPISMSCLHQIRSQQPPNPTLHLATEVGLSSFTLPIKAAKRRACHARAAQFQLVWVIELDFNHIPQVTLASSTQILSFFPPGAGYWINIQHLPISPFDCNESSMPSGPLLHPSNDEDWCPCAVLSVIMGVSSHIS